MTSDSAEPTATCEQVQNAPLGELAAGSYSVVAQLVRSDGTLLADVSVGQRRRLNLRSVSQR